MADRIKMAETWEEKTLCFNNIRYMFFELF